MQKNQNEKEKKRARIYLCTLLVIFGFMGYQIFNSEQQKIYTVIPGDTWYGIAEKFEITAEELASFNHRLLEDELYPDQQIKIPLEENLAVAPFPSLETEKVYQTERKEIRHMIKKGETLYAIAERYSIDVQELVLINKLENPNLIYWGQELIICPKAREDESETTAAVTTTAVTTSPPIETTLVTTTFIGPMPMIPHEEVQLKNVVIELTTESTEENSLFNIALACEKLNGYVLYPGETFSWFEVIGPADESQGYKIATAFANGEVVSSPGGGVCLVSTALMQAARSAGCEIIERHDHGLPVSYATPGDEATVSYGWLDLKFRNPSENQAIIFHCTADGQTCKVETFS